MTESATFVIDRDRAPDDEINAMLDEALAARADLAVIHVSGPGALQCLQGLLTNDLDARGAHGFIYGAILTPKGMIISDMWVSRGSDGATLYVTRSGKESVLDSFKRSIPPRLATFADLSHERTVVRIVGAHALDVIRNVGAPIPEVGCGTRGSQYAVARPPAGAPFAVQVDCDESDYDDLITQLTNEGATVAAPHFLDIARIVAGWPHLGFEIGDKTLPQEVRYDQLGGVSYSKGCYTGQETVARLHFRGHVNKRILGLRWETVPDASSPAVLHDDRKVGHMTSVAWVAPLGGYLGLGMIHSAVEPGTRVMAGGLAAKTVQLPFHHFE